MTRRLILRSLLAFSLTGLVSVGAVDMSWAQEKNVDDVLQTPLPDSDSDSDSDTEPPKTNGVTPGPEPSKDATAPQPDTPPSPVPAAPAPAAQAEPEPAPPVQKVAQNVVDPSIKLKGVVWRTKPGIVFLKTPIGLMTLSSKTTLKGSLASQEIILWVHEQSVAVDIVKRADQTRVHRYLSGPLTRSTEDAKKLVWWTPEGEKDFTVGNSLAARREGEMVTVEVDHADTVTGVHDLQFDIQVGQVPTGGSDVHLLLTGTVAKLKSNFIFLRTPIGIVNINTKIGIKNAKVGQNLTLHMRHQHVVADLSPGKDAARTRRFVTGPLRFATEDRTSLLLWLPDGEHTYTIDRGVKSILSGVREGSPITVEFNGDGTVVDIERLR